MILFFKALSIDIVIPISALIQIVKGEKMIKKMI